VTKPGLDIDSATAAMLLRSCHSRRLDREGIPMIVALADERHPTATSGDDRTRYDGRRYGDLLGTYAELLTPSSVFRPDDEGALITVLQVLAYAHFPSPSDPLAPPPATEPP
jgi:hypothetical protein